MLRTQLATPGPFLRPTTPRPIGLAIGLGFLALLATSAGPGARPARAQAPDSTGDLPAAPASAADTTPPALNSSAGMARGLPFGPGESLRFSIEYGLLKAGSAWLEVAPMATYRGRRCYHLVSRAESNDFMSAIFKVRDRIDSLIDADGLYSWRYRKRMREGGYRQDYDVFYDQRAHRALYADGRSFDISPWSKDGLAAFYYVRHMPLEVGKDIRVAHHSDKRSTTIVVKVHGREHVKTPAGEYDCFVIEPVMEAGSIFAKKGKLLIWVTDDERRLPVLMKSKVAVGSITAVLNEVKLGGPAGGAGAPGTQAASGF